MGLNTIIELERQQEVLDDVEEDVDRTQGTMHRLKGYLAYFGRTYCRDKLALCLIATNLVVIIAIIVISLL